MPSIPWWLPPVSIGLTLATIVGLRLWHELFPEREQDHEHVPADFDAVEAE